MGAGNAPLEVFIAAVDKMDGNHGYDVFKLQEDMIVDVALNLKKNKG